MSLILYLIIPLVILVFSKHINSEKYNIYDFILLGILICICGFRYNVGTDYQLYTQMYNHLDYYPRVEVVFKLLINICNTLHFPSWLFFFLISCVSLTLVYLTIKKNSKHPSESIFLYVTLGFYALSFNIIRQTLALSIIFYSIRYIKSRNFFKYCICIFLTYLIHKTSIIMLPLYFVGNMKISKKFSCIILCILAFISMFYHEILQFIVRLLPTYQVYLTINNYTYDPAGIGTYVILFINLLLWFFMFLNKEKLIKYNPDNNLYFNLFTFSFLFYFLSLSNTIMVRLGYYMSIFLVYLLPDLYRVSRLKVNNTNSLFLFFGFTLYYIIHLICFNNMIPYSFIFFN